MKEVNLNKNLFWYDGNSVNDLGMGDDKHIRFTAVDIAYNLEVTKPDGTSAKFPVPKDDTYHPYEIVGSKGQTYTFSIPASIEGTVPQMIVKIS